MSNFVDGDELIVNIVSRLPVESVLWCRCVCKRWRALLHELYFIQIHTERTLLQHIDDDVSLFMLGNMNNNTSSYECYLQDYAANKYDDGDGGVNSSSSHHKKVLNPFPPPAASRYYSLAVTKWAVIGSVNGLICLYGVKISSCNLSCSVLQALLIYNPITKEYLNLPGAAVSVAIAVASDIKDDRIEAIGFGYHPSTKEYKIVMIIRILQRYHNDRWLHLIYTLGSKHKWRTSKVGVPPAATYQACTYGSFSAKGTHVNGAAKGTHVNGAIYWLTESPLTIVSFDLEDEKFRIIHAPHSAAARCCFQLLGGGGGERLCVVCMVRQNSQDIWVMNINGDHQYSWTKKFSIPVILGTFIRVHELIAFRTGAAGSRDRVVCLCKNDKQRSKFFISFDCRAKTFESLGDIKAGWSLIDITCCTKSVVSLKALGEEDAKVLQPPAPAAAPATTKTQMMIKLLGFAMVTIQLLQFTSIISAAFVC